MKKIIKCKRINKRIEVSHDAVEADKWGWFCECGRWTGLDKEKHEVFQYGTT